MRQITSSEFNRLSMSHIEISESLINSIKDILGDDVICNKQNIQYSKYSNINNIKYKNSIIIFNIESDKYILNNFNFSKKIYYICHSKCELLNKLSLIYSTKKCNCK